MWKQNRKKRMHEKSMPSPPETEQLKYNRKKSSSQKENSSFWQSWVVRLHFIDNVAHLPIETCHEIWMHPVVIIS